MSIQPVQGLPLLPGSSFRDPTKTAFHRSQTLVYKNGFAFKQLPKVGIGGTRLHVNQLSQAELDELSNKRPTLTYGEPKQAPPSDFIPAHVAFDKKGEEAKSIPGESVTEEQFTDEEGNIITRKREGYKVKTKKEIRHVEKTTYS